MIPDIYTPDHGPARVARRVQVGEVEDGEVWPIRGECGLGLDQSQLTWLAAAVEREVGVRQLLAVVAGGEVRRLGGVGGQLSPVHVGGGQQPAPLFQVLPRKYFM